jgi:hypothetical protein
MAEFLSQVQPQVAQLRRVDDHGHFGGRPARTREIAGVVEVNDLLEALEVAVVPEDFAHPPHHGHTWDMC